MHSLWYCLIYACVKFFAFLVRVHNLFANLQDTIGKYYVYLDFLLWNSKTVKIFKIISKKSDRKKEEKYLPEALMQET